MSSVCLRKTPWTAGGAADTCEENTGVIQVRLNRRVDRWAATGMERTEHVGKCLKRKQARCG